jgi:hypothetical protein
MADYAPEVFLQSLGDPLADRALLSASMTSHAMDQALGQFDGEDLFDFWNRQWGGLLLSGLYVACGLARRNAKPNSQTRDDLGPSLFLLQKLNGLIHAPVILGYGRSTQYDTSILPYTSTSILIHRFGFDPGSERTPFVEDAN